MVLYRIYVKVTRLEDAGECRMDKQRILIVDDEEINRVILAEMLRDG